ncbi:MAG TPA: AraC family transcriptional regulator [Pyrinomonadaceae bacterium]|jgi:AraC family transcriptional regulator
MLKKLEPGCSHGKVLKSFDNAGFIMSEIAYSARGRLSEHSHEHAHFCFVLQGTYIESDNKQEIECKPLTLTFRPPGELHKDKFHNQEVRVFTIEIPPRWIERLQQDSIYLGSSSNFQGGVISRLSQRLVREVQRMDTAASLIIEGLTLEIMAETARHSAQNVERTVPYWLKQAKDLIHARFAENLTLEQIASEVGVHPIHLASVFRQKYLCTVGEYIRGLRIEYACREIERGELPLALIALEAGFANQGHFSSTFKRLTGFTPVAYRNSFRQS